MARVVVGLSGGVDSSVAAYLLQREGHEVIAVFMRNWHDESVTLSAECPWLEDSNDAMLVADTLGIPFHVLDLSVDYKHRIVDYMFSEYQNGRTPNPDVLCNREIKFDVFLKAAISLGADFVATGHYCRKESEEINGKLVYKLLAGKDDNKDQTYFLCQISQEQLAKALFPIGELQKSEVREIAAKMDLVTANKKDSQGLCFIGKVKLPIFLQQQLEPKEGIVIEIDKTEKPKLVQISDCEHIIASSKYQFNPKMGKEIGKHNGAHYYTVGQRKGLNIGGKAEPLFIVEKDTEQNIIYVGQGETHPHLLRMGLFIKKEEIHWLRTDLELESGKKENYKVRIRYRQPLENATLFSEEEGLYIVFENSQVGIASGQFAVWYKGDELIGSGAID